MVPVEVVAEEKVVEGVIDGEQVVCDGDVIPDDLYVAIVAQVGVFLDDDGDVILA